MSRPVRSVSVLVAIVCFHACDGQPVTDQPHALPATRESEAPVAAPAPDGGGARDRTTPSRTTSPAAVPPDATTATPPATVVIPTPAQPAAASSATPPPLEAGATVAMPPPPVVAPTLPASGQDEAITSAAYRVLALQSGLSAEGKVVTISTVDGKVMLRGVVTTTAERERIVAAIGRLPGVRTIEDLLDVREH